MVQNPDSIFINPIKLKDLNGIQPLKAISGQGSLNVNITRYFTDVDGVILNKSSVAIPSTMKTAYPVFMLGNFDRVGGYNVGQKTLPINPNYVFLMTYVHGVNEPFLWSSGFNTVQTRFKKGDIICVFTDSLDAPSCFAFIVQTCEYGGLASIISNTQTQQTDGKIGVMSVKNISYQVDNANQLAQVWQIVTLDNLGQFQQNPFNPIIAKNPYVYKLDDFLLLEFSFIFTQYIAINFLMNYESDTINVNFRINK